MNRIYKIRSVFVFLLFISLYLIILCNLYSIQIAQQTFYTQLGKQQYHITITSKPARALIYDRNNQSLTLNKDTLSAFILPKKLKNLEQLERFLKKYFPQALQCLYKKRDEHFMFVKRKLTEKQIQLIKSCNIKDIKFLQEPNRYYPVPCTGQIVGITDIDNNGLFGIELMFNTQLAGTNSRFSLEKDARSGHFYFKKETKIEGSIGKTVQLTIDSDLQFLVYEELKETVERFNAQEGSVLILNPSTGEILTMVNYPDFDPNDTTELNLENTKNKIATESYELGSVLKVFVGLAALEEKVVDPDELINCEESKIAFINSTKVSTWKAHGLIPFSEVIQRSNNIGIAKVALRLGPKLFDHYCRVGFGTKTCLRWPGEQSGFVNSPDNWSRPSIISLSFGYEITATLLQLAQAFCLLANYGIPIKPHIVKQSINNVPRKPLYSPEIITIMRDILEQTVIQGTAHRAHIAGYRIMGKTGTANMVIDGTYSNEHNVYTFAGMVEKDDYKRIIVTFIKDAQGINLYASTVTVPLFERVAETVLIHDNVIVKEANL